MLAFIQKNFLQILTLVFMAGGVAAIIKFLFNDFHELKDDYYEFKEDLIDRLARIEEKMKK